MRRGQEKGLLFFCLIYIKGCLAGDDIITSGPVRAKLGQSVSLSCRIKDEKHMSLSEWRFCNDSTTIAVFKAGEQNSTHIEEQYTSRVSITQYHTLTILRVQDRDYGDYCCKVAAFPQGSLEGRIQLLKQNDNEEVSHSPAGLPAIVIVYITCGVVGFVVLVGFISALVFRKRRRKIRNPVHVTVTNNISHKQPSLLQKDPYTTSHTTSHTSSHAPRGDEDDVDMYLTVRTSV